MGRELINQELTLNNIDDARLDAGVDPVDTLRRIARAWLSLKITCKCGSNAACDICEIDYLLCEAFRLPSHY